ncbi:enhanced intracellular survival protein Eis [Spirillospora sp. NPDC048911]|uniref:GNAT family N-acetyltransferase n=1 Tax=Spirillospora sp. NPDC048911 TaxID=3364527 RepID=UPI0037161870
MEIRAVDDFDLVRDLRARAFGPLNDAEWESSRRFAAAAVAAGRVLGAFDGDRLVAAARINDMRQWWHGGPVPAAGIGGVMVAPEERGRGLGRRLMTVVLERSAELGHAVSMLYPATTHLYRSMGWEHAGARSIVTLPADALRSVAAERVPVRRAGPGDAAVVAATVREIHESARDDGPVDWPDERWRAMLAVDDRYCYLAEDGFLAYEWDAGNTALRVERLVAGSERTLRSLCAIVGSNSSIAATVRACLAPHDPVLWLLGDRAHEDVHQERWMSRVVDAPAAIGARGYPAGVTAEIPLLVEDAQLPSNAGSWRLVIKDGEGALERSADDHGAVRMGARGLSALYAGVPVATLRRTGLIAAGEDEAAALSAAFAARPFSLDYF